MSDPRRRLADLYVGAIALAMGALFVFWGARGLVGFSRGLRTDTTDPAIGVLGVVGGVWMLATAGRLFRGPRQRRMLFSGPELIVVSLLTLVGAAWSFTFAPGDAVAFAAVGVAGIVRWIYLRRADRNQPASG